MGIRPAPAFGLAECPPGGEADRGSDGDGDQTRRCCLGERRQRLFFGITCGGGQGDGGEEKRGDQAVVVSAFHGEPTAHPFGNATVADDGELG